MHGRAHYLRQSMGIWFWAAAIPLAGLALAYRTRGLSLLFVALMYLVLFARAYRGVRSRAASSGLAMEYAFFNVLSKFPMLSGMMQYWLGRATGKKSRIIEYKGTPGTAKTTAKT
jgi:hypothetical protein